MVEKETGLAYSFFCDEHLADDFGVLVSILCQLSCGEFPDITDICDD
jgi:hypothetical protein